VLNLENKNVLHENEIMLYKKDTFKSNANHDSKPKGLQNSYFLAFQKCHIITRGGWSKSVIQTII